MRPIRAALTPQAWITALSVGALLVALVAPGTAAPPAEAKTALTPAAAAAKVDELILATLAQTKTQPAPLCNDEDFLRRASFDIAGAAPTAADVTLFGLDGDSHKRQKLVERLLNSPDYAANWSRYWRDVIFLRATEARVQIARSAFESWMADEIANNTKWNDVATKLLTATGKVQENGATALIFAQQANSEEIAAEVSRIFLGVQIQCANCHDHPSDQWKREQFHQLAAFFPRIQLRREANAPASFEVASLNRGAERGRDQFQELLANPERLIRMADRNRDGKLSKEEMTRGQGGGRLAGILFEQGDTNKDGLLTVEELKKIPPRPQRTGQGSTEHFMVDLENPTAKGKQIDPQFFLTDATPGAGLDDLDRRQAVAGYITGNPWFAKAFVNRLWFELLGDGFYMPVDDIGPTREARNEAALTVLADGFTANGYDVKWLFKAITSTDAYQRQIRPREKSADAPALAASQPSRLRADQLYSSLVTVLGFNENGAGGRGRPGMAMGYRGDNSPRGQFAQLFGFDPSTLPEDITGTIPQALFFMNSPQIANAIRATGATRLATLLKKFPDDKDATIELYLAVHSREPSAKELATCLDYVKEVKNRNEAFEDIFWSLLNSSEFLSKR